MKKLIIIFISMVCLFFVGGCQSQSGNDDLTSVLKSHHLKVEWDDTELFWMFSFDDMHFTVIFNDDQPKEYFAQHSLTYNDIKTIQVYPIQEKSNQFIYINYEDNQAVIDEQDIKDNQDQGKQETYKVYQNKMDDLDITTESLGEWTIRYFNDNTRQELVSEMKQRSQQLVSQLKDKGYSYEKDESGRVIISPAKGQYKMVIANQNCMVVDAGMDLSGGEKTGYMYTPKQGTVGYLVKDETHIIYQYKDNTVLQGKPTLAQYATFKNMKKWYDSFLHEMNTNLTILSTL